MNPRAVLADNLAEEAEAYGYTLSIWGSGALLIDAYGTPGLTRVFVYVAGALVGFAALALVAFDGVLDTARVESANSPLVVSTVHIAATSGSLVAAFGAIHLSLLSPLVTFGVVGLFATVVYNLLLLAEELLARLLDERAPSG